jgi:hypothetical protein
VPPRVPQNISAGLKRVRAVLIAGDLPIVTVQTSESNSVQLESSNSSKGLPALSTGDNTGIKAASVRLETQRSENAPVPFNHAVEMKE